MSKGSADAVPRSRGCASQGEGTGLAQKGCHSTRPRAARALAAGDRWLLQTGEVKPVVSSLISNPITLSKKLKPPPPFKQGCVHGRGVGTCLVSGTQGAPVSESCVQTEASEGLHVKASVGHITLLSFKVSKLQLFVFKGADVKAVNRVGHHNKAELLLRASTESRPSAGGAFQPPPTRALGHSPWLTSHHAAWTGSCLASGQPATETQLRGLQGRPGFVCGPQRQLRKVKVYRVLFAKTGGPLDHLYLQVQGTVGNRSSQERGIWAWGILLNRLELAANDPSRPYCNSRPKSSKKTNTVPDFTRNSGCSSTASPSTLAPTLKKLYLYR